MTTETVLAFEPLSNHGDGMNVLMRDCRVEFVNPERAAGIAAQAAKVSFPVVLPPELTL